MSELRQLQQSFLGRLMDTPSDISGHIQSTSMMSAEERLNIYANGYRLRLKEAITSDFEQLGRYLGDDLFEQLMDAYIDSYPSDHTSLRYYSRYMEQILEQQTPFSNHSELVELARIEQAFNTSFDAANCPTIDTEQLIELKPDKWPLMGLRFHASVQQLPLKTNSFAIWKALSEEQAPPAVEDDESSWIIWRKDLVSQYRALSEPESRALGLMLAGANFSKMCEALLDYFDEDKTPVQAITYLQSWIKDKMVCQLL